MKIASWNVNSIRARQERLMAWLVDRKPEVVCLQELKCHDDVFPSAELKTIGYFSEAYGQKTYNGVAILARSDISDVHRGLRDGVEDPQSRFISAKVNGVRVISVYAPNGQEVGSEAYAYKLRWYERLRTYLDTHHSPDEPLVICGDFNVAPEPRDVYDPAGWENQTLFSPPEREALQKLCAFGLVDTFRQHHEEAGRYSWWDYRMLSFPKNKGLRIDHVFATRTLAQKCTAADIDREARKGKQPSDHAPVWAEFAL
ncbi:MAG: exodeoxyribonuclease III [Myxococcales bacterium]